MRIDRYAAREATKAAAYVAILLLGVAVLAVAALAATKLGGLPPRAILLALTGLGLALVWGLVYRLISRG